MKKNFVKKLALGLALVMAVTSVPASSEAAATPGFKSSAVKVRVGQTKKYSTENSKKYSVKFKIGNKKVATIKYTAGSKSVKVTGVAEGKTTLRADFKSYKTKKVTTAKVPVTVLAAKEEAPVVVAPELATVTQKAANVVEVTFTADASAKFTTDNFKVESADGTYTLAVKSVEFTTDGKAAKVTTYGNFIDKTVFDVTCGEKTVSFTASIGEVKTAVINTVQAEANVRTPISFTLYNAEGIDITAAASVDKYASLYVDGDYFEVNTVVPSKANLTLSNVGGTVTVTLVYDPVSATGELIQVEGTITCVDTKASTGKTTYFTKGNDYSTGKPKIYLNSYAADTTIYADDSTETFYFTALDANGNPIVYDSYAFESSNEDVISVNDGYFDAALAQVQVTPQGVGTAKVVITAVKNDVKTVYAQTVKVNAERRLASIVLDKNTVSVTAVSGGSTFVNDNDKVTVMLKDQYGNLMTDPDVIAKLSVTAEEKHNGTAKLVDPATKVTTLYGNAITKIGVEANTDKKGSHIVEVTATDGEYTVSKRFNVVVRTINGSLTPTYKVELGTNAVDLNPEVLAVSFNPSGNVSVKVAQYYGTVFAGYMSTSADANSNNKVEKLTVRSNGKYFQSVNLENISTSATGVTRSAFDLAATNLTAPAGFSLTTMKKDNNTIHLASIADANGSKGVANTGTYTVQASITKGAATYVSATANFTVKNTMELPKVTVDATTGEGNNALALVQDCVTTDVAVLGDETVIISDVTTANVNNSIAADALASGKVVVKYVAITDTFGTTNYVYYVPVSRTFRLK